MKKSPAIEKLSYNELLLLNDINSTPVGDAYFDLALKKLAKNFVDDQVFIAEYKKKTTSLETFYYYAKGKLQDNFEYSLIESPYNQILKSNVHFYPNIKQELFILSENSKPLKIKSYLALALKDIKRNLIGVIALVNRKAILELEKKKRILSGIVSRTESELQRSQNAREVYRYKKYFSVSTDLLFIANTKGHFIKINPTFKAVLGLSEKKILTTPIIDLVHPSDRDKTINELSNLLAGQPTLDFENRYLCKNGQYKIFRWTSTLDKNSNLIYAAARDVTDRKKTEKMLLDANTIINRSSTVAFLWQNKTSWPVEFVSENVYTIFEYTRQDFLENAVSYSNLIYLNDLERVNQEVYENSQDKDTKTFKHMPFRIKTKSGNIKWIEATTFIRRDHSGQISHYEGIVQDVTQRIKLENQLLQSQKLESLGQLAAGVAHEINTPIQYISDNVTFLQGAFENFKSIYHEYQNLKKQLQSNLEYKPLIEKIENLEREQDVDFLLTEFPQAILQSLEGSKRISEIVLSIKEFSHPGAKHKEKIDLNKAIENTIHVSKNVWREVAHIKTNYDNTIPAVLCYAGEIKQVLLNLIVNAAHAISCLQTNERGIISISTKLVNKHINIKIKDTGVGIAEENRSKIFDLFFTTKEVGQGSGQGLSLTHQIIVKKHQGKISFRTELGKGTAFFIELPVDNNGDSAL